VCIIESICWNEVGGIFLSSNLMVASPRTDLLELSSYISCTLDLRNRPPRLWLQELGNFSIFSLDIVIISLSLGFLKRNFSLFWYCNWFAQGSAGQQPGGDNWGATWMKK
jgi:hypothetical protein